MDDLLLKINSILNEADFNIAQSAKKHLMAQFHNEIKNVAAKCNLNSQLPELVKYHPGYLDTVNDEVLLAALEIELDNIKIGNPTVVSTNKSKTSSVG